MSNPDLRTWLAAMQAQGEVQDVAGAEREEEIGGIVDIYQRKMGRRGAAVRRRAGLSARLSRARQHPHLGEAHRADARPAGGDQRGRSRALLARLFPRRPRRSPPRAVNTGPVLENVTTGDAIDILTIPTPRWHEHDGGHYIGTGCMVVMKDPETGWINYGAYRVQAHDRRSPR